MYRIEKTTISADLYFGETLIGSAFDCDGFYPEDIIPNIQISLKELMEWISNTISVSRELQGGIP
jgi:hypothetical protein